MSRTLIFLIILTAVLVWGCTRNSAHPNGEQEILALERSGLDQWAARNPLGFAANFADDVSYSDDLGGQLRIDGIEAVRKYFSTLEGQIPPHKYELVNTRVQLYGDVGILTFQWHGFTPDGKLFSKYRVTSVYRYDGDKWRTVHTNWSEIKEAS
jgi:ketosteroid isomerase-like protein